MNKPFNCQHLNKMYSIEKNTGYHVTHVHNEIQFISLGYKHLEYPVNFIW